MKKILIRVLVLMLLAVLCLGAVACSKEDDTPEGMQNVSIENATFDLFVPAGWVAQTSSGISGARVSNTDTSNVTVTVYLPAEVLTAESYWQNYCLSEYQNGVLKNFSVVEEKCGDTTLGGLNAKKYVFVYTLDGKSYEVMQVLTVKDDNVYTLTFTAESANFAGHEENMESIRSNFRFR